MVMHMTCRNCNADSIYPETVIFKKSIYLILLARALTYPCITSSELCCFLYWLKPFGFISVSLYRFCKLTMQFIKFVYSKKNYSFMPGHDLFGEPIQ